MCLNNEEEKLQETLPPNSQRKLLYSCVLMVVAIPSDTNIKKKLDEGGTSVTSGTKGSISESRPVFLELNL